jgi:hypothetical protein
VAAARIIEERPRKARPPFRQHRLEPASLHVSRKPLLEAIDHADPTQRGGYLQIHHVRHQRPFPADPHFAAVALELHRRLHSARKAMADADVAHQLARMLGLAVRGEI